MFYHDIKSTMTPTEIDLWNRSKNQFITKYFLGKDYVTEQMKRGTGIHELIEVGLKEPKINLKNKEELITIQVGDYTLRGKMDAYEGNQFVDYKTGKLETAQKAVDSIKQEIYAFIIFKLTNADEVIGYTEHIDSGEVFEKKYTPEIVEKWDKGIPEYAQEVNEAYEKFLHTPEEAKNILDRYEELKTNHDKIKAEMDALKKELMEVMEREKLERIDYTLNAYIIERRTPIYSDEVKQKIEELKKQKDGEKITRILTIR